MASSSSSSFFSPTRFVWRWGGNQVHLCGSFTRWVETVPMPPVEGQPGTFSVIVHLPPGYHQYKFIVDGEWRHDETQPFMPDPLGNVNNWLFVRKPDSSSSSGMNLGSHNSLHSHLQQANPQQQQQQQQHGAAQQGLAQRSASVADIDMQPTETAGDGVLAPIALQSDEPQYTRKKVREFLQHHSAYELIPESGKVVLLDVDLPVRQAFHALHEQGIASAPLWDSDTGAICGTISASDFIHILQRLRSVVSGGNNPLSEQEMDQHTIRLLREEAVAEGRQLKPLVYVEPSNSLADVVKTLLGKHCSMAPVLGGDPRGKGSGTAELLHIATLSGVLACLMRHFRASLASLPLLAQPLYAVPVGTHVPGSRVEQQQQQQQQQQAGGGGGAQPRPVQHRIAQLLTVTPATPLTQALGLLLEGGVSCLPVVDPTTGVLLDIFARADIAMLAKGNAYSRLQYEDVTVGQALALAVPQAAVAPPPPQPGWPTSAPGGGGSSSALAAGEAKAQRVHVCTSNDSLRAIVERLSVPGVRRLVVVHPETRRAEGVVSLSDVATYLLT